MHDETVVRGARSEQAAAEHGLQSLCGMFAVGPDGSIDGVNGIFLDWTGYGREEVVGRRSFEDFLSPAERIFFQAQCQPMLQLEESIHEMSLRLVTKGGARLPVLVNAALRRDGQGRVVATDFTVFNAGERWRYQDELRKSRACAEESDTRQRELNQRLMESNAVLHAQTER